MKKQKIGNTRREREYIQNNQTEILEAENTMLEIQMSLIGLINRMEITKENIQCTWKIGQ